MHIIFIFRFTGDKVLTKSVGGLRILVLVKVAGLRIGELHRIGRRINPCEITGELWVYS